jgi:hypothetical protein
MANPMTRLVKNKSSIKHFIFIFYEWQCLIKQKIIIIVLRNKICSNLLNSLTDLSHIGVEFFSLGSSSCFQSPKNFTFTLKNSVHKLHFEIDVGSERNF